MLKKSAHPQISQQRILEELSRIAFGDLRGAASWGPDGIGLISSADLTEEQAATLAEIAETAKGLLKVKRHDKLKALELLMKHLGMLDGRTVAAAGADLGALEKARQRAAARE